MKKIINKAIEGGYETNTHFLNSEDDTKRLFRWCVLDPLFWQALGKSCGWEQSNDFYKLGQGRIYNWHYYALEFHEINLIEGWDKAVEYLKDLIK
jgi:hypothetical protein